MCTTVSIYWLTVNLEFLIHSFFFRTPWNCGDIHFLKISHHKGSIQLFRSIPKFRITIHIDITLNLTAVIMFELELPVLFFATHPHLLNLYLRPSWKLRTRHQIYPEFIFYWLLSLEKWILYKRCYTTFNKKVINLEWSLITVLNYSSLKRKLRWACARGLNWQFSSAHCYENKTEKKKKIKSLPVKVICIKWFG